MKTSSASLDLGAQPLGYPSGVLSAVIQRDRILARALAEANRPLKTHAFKRGADMLPLLADGRLDAGLLGDMPTLLAAAQGSVWIAGLVKQSSTAIVAKGDMQVRDLVGKRIAFVEASSAHLTLLQGLATAGIAPTQVTLMTMGVADMPAALERGEIDAFAAWEPAPTIALGSSKKNHIVFRGQSSDYFVIERSFAQQAPQAVQQLLAAYLRAIEWMRRSQANLERAARWAIADTQAFTGAAPGSAAAVSVERIAAITRRELLDVPSAPSILFNPAAPTLQSEFQFLAKLGKLPPGASWNNVQSALVFQGLTQVQSQARVFELRSFDYAD
ncbi:ABC transporter substrate-binding protein [Paucibacter sp. hw8]|uniref:ABC transporter substrate-binding protein n=1 Tax=Roseateles albus TaxID=2987525 RepID=A0ABT5K9K1_9BURK|nr:ABC transporter substrate-binding protein [Roseateles albus]